MAGSLIKIDEFTVSSAVASIILGGGSNGSSGLNASIDSTYNVYMVAFENFAGATDTVVRKARITKSGTIQTDAEYDSAFKGLNVDASFDNSATANQTDFSFGWSGTGTYEKGAGIMYLYNFNNASEYSFGTFETVGVNFAANTRGQTGGFVHTVASASDGISFHLHSGNIASGEFKLYGLNK